jgi:pilus assembly protein CpaF
LNKFNWDEAERERINEYKEAGNRGHEVTIDDVVKYQKELLEVYLKKEPEERTQAQQREFLNILIKETSIPGNAHYITIESVLDDQYDNGPLKELFQWEGVTDVQVYVPFREEEEQRILYMQNGKRAFYKGAKFRDRIHALSWVNNKLATIGQRFDPATITANGMLPDNSRIHVIYGPSGYSTWDRKTKIYKFVRCIIITIRRFSSFVDSEKLLNQVEPIFSPPNLRDRSKNLKSIPEQWTKHVQGAVDRATMDYLRIMVQMALNHLVAGGTGAGKTTWANALTSYIPDIKIMLVIEEEPELQPQVPHAIRLFESKPNVIGENQLVFLQADALKESLRMFPNRIFIAELRDAIAYTFFMAIQNGHDGSSSTIHASDCASALRQVTVFAKSHPDKPSEEYIHTVIRERLHNVIHLTNDEEADKRYVDEIVEVVPLEDGGYKLHTVMRYEKGVDENGDTVGYFHFYGPSQRFLQKMSDKRIPIPESWLSPEMGVAI